MNNWKQSLYANAQEFDRICKSPKPVKPLVDDRYFCAPCRYNAKGNARLMQHCKTKQHLIKTGELEPEEEKERYYCESCNYLCFNYQCRWAHCKTFKHIENIKYT